MTVLGTYNSSVPVLILRVRHKCLLINNFFENMKEIKANGSGRKAGYTAPSTRVIDVKMSTAILGVSEDNLTTDTEDGGNI